VRLDRAMGALSPDMRATLLLRFADGLSYAEIAASTGVSIGTVMSRLFNGRRRLKALIEEDWK
jgi:RNA polymerase sigma-70 factor (ECF subfamily)